MRPRAVSTSAGVGAVFVANVEHLLKDVTHRGERVEPPLLHLVEQTPQLRVVLYRLLDVPARARRCDLEHLAREIAPPPLLELALGVEPRAVLRNLRSERVEPLAAHRLGKDDRW